VYLSSRGGPDGLRKYEHGTDVELWDGASAAVEAPPAISADGARICFAARRGERSQLYVMAGDGSGVRPIAESLDVLGGPTMSPDGRWVAAVVAEAGVTPLYKIPVDGGAAVRLVDGSEGVLSQPVWSPDGKIIVHTVSKISKRLHLRAVTPDGAAVSMPDVDFVKVGTQYRFLPDSSALVVMRGSGITVYGVRGGNFWTVDLSTGDARQLTDLAPVFHASSFDVSVDGRQVVFERYRESSDIVLIDLPSADAAAPRSSR
jgi:Tol biopolymer transport system component